MANAYKMIGGLIGVLGWLLRFARLMLVSKAGGLGESSGVAPLHVIESPAPGSGKGLLCQLISITATGESD